MKLQTMFKGMLVSQGYVGTPRALREIAPEAWPTPAASVAATPAASGTGAPEGPTAIDVAGLMPWQLAYGRTPPPATPADPCCA